MKIANVFVGEVVRKNVSIDVFPPSFGGGMRCSEWRGNDNGGGTFLPHFEEAGGGT